MVLEAISKLDPTVFENLAFDLLQSAGLRNIVWRTPGADGGRDIEGQFLFNDLSGSITVQKWYVECKRYSSAVDWPTLWSKIAYADAQQADFLLLFTNSNPSPQCETQLSNWNAQRRGLQVRVWRGYQIERVVLGYPAVATKYGLRQTGGVADADFLPLMTDVMKVAQASYTALELNGDPKPGLEVAAALTELISLRMAQVRSHGRISLAEPAVAVPDYDWLTWRGPVDGWENCGIRAFLTAYRCYLAAPSLEVNADKDEARLVPRNCRGTMTPAVESSLANVALWADVEMGLFEEGTLALTIRRRDSKAKQ